MAEFLTPVDIANRALQLCGTSRIDGLGFTEDSKNASEVAFAYGKCRRAELMNNSWGFSIKRAVLRAIDTNTMTLAPALWVASTTYFVGCIVSDETGTLWQSRIPDNLGNQPENSLTWEPYFGPLTASLYDPTLAYYAGEIVYTTAGDGTYRPYISLTTGNSDVPGTATAYDATAVYMKDDVVTYLSVAYLSLIDLNTNQTPSSAPALWSGSTTYASGTKVGGSDGVIYQSVINGNIGNDPTVDDGTHWTNTGVLNPWTTVFVSGSGSMNWRQIGGKEFPMGVALQQLNIIFPLGSGPSAQSGTNNLFHLPAAYLRTAPPDPKMGYVTPLGGPNFLCDDDHVREGDFIISSDSIVILRFVADVTDVSKMPDLFCEALAASVAKAVCDALTQSQSQLAGIKQAYKEAVSAAKVQNGIEQGVQQPPDDELIACRW